jgi:hypothetical protein
LIDLVRKTLLKLISQSLKQLSGSHALELMRRGNRDLRQYSIFLDVLPSNGQFAQGCKSESVAQLINSQLKKTKGGKPKNERPPTRFKYIPGEIDYIVVDDDFLDHQMAVQVARVTKDLLQQSCFGDLGIEGKSKRALDYLREEPLSRFIARETHIRLMEVISAGGEAMIRKLVKNFERRQEIDEQKLAKVLASGPLAGSKSSLAKMRHGLINHVEANVVKQVRRRLAMDDNIVSLYEQFIQRENPQVPAGAKFAKIIAERDFKSFLSYWDSQEEAWHQQRTVSLHPDYQRVQYSLQCDFVISKTAQPDQRQRMFDHSDRQVFHRFRKIADNDGERERSHYESVAEQLTAQGVDLQAYDIHRYNFEAPEGTDPCQTKFERELTHQLSGDLTKRQKTDRIRQRVKLGSMTEGVYRQDLPHIAKPRPLNSHNYCQVCNESYAQFDEHVATEQHRVKSRCQPSLLDIDAMCAELMKDCMQEAKDAVR